LNILYEESSVWVFFFLTVVLGGGAAFLAGRALATGWKPLWMAVAYMIPLGATLRFLHYALFQGTLLSPHFFVVDTLVLIAGALLGYRLTRVSQMTRQYPWLYERTGPFGWRNRAP
jgi:hypothetical protein